MTVHALSISTTSPRSDYILSLPALSEEDAVTNQSLLKWCLPTYLTPEEPMVSPDDLKCLYTQAAIVRD